MFRSGRGTGAVALSTSSRETFGAGICFPLLILHLISAEPAYGNRLIESIEAITQGVISVNPNTMYPLLRELEGRGLVEGRLEAP